MKKILLLATLLGTSVLSVAPMASADDFDGFWDKDRFQIRARAIGIFADGDGTVVPGGAKTDVTYSVTPEVDLTYFVNKNVALELIAATAKHKVEAGGGELGKTWILPPTLTLQYHFTPDKSNGRISIEMVSALWALLEKYFPESIKNDRLVGCNDN